jgi:hypothetical protein
MTFLVTEALVTSFVPKAVALMVVPVPSEIPKTSGELVCEISETVFAEIVRLFSYPVQIPPLATLLGATALIRF